MTPATVGFVGVGSIAAAMVEGLVGSAAAPDRVVLSPRGAATAAELASRFPSVAVARSNAEVVAAADVLVLSVRPDQLQQACSGLTARAGQVVVSVLAGVPGHTVRTALRAPTGTTVVRAIPMPPVRHRAGLTVLTPGEPRVVRLFEALGGAMVVGDETELAVYSTLTGAVSGLLRYVEVVVEWAERAGLDRRQAESFFRHLAASLTPAVADLRVPIAQVVTGHETPGGLNEQLREEVFGAAGTQVLLDALDHVHRRVTG